MTVLTLSLATDANLLAPTVKLLQPFMRKTKRIKMKPTRDPDKTFSSQEYTVMTGLCESHRTTL